VMGDLFAVALTTAASVSCVLLMVKKELARFR
jgi:hypothetical protein